VLKPMFAARSLREAAFAVRDALDRDDLESARRALGSLCSRRADTLDAEELVAATIESVAENTSDSVVAPLLFFACGGVPAAIFYRCVNTLDAMVGYRGRLEYAGKASARLDDLLNLVPARVTGVLLLAAGALTGQSARGGARILLRDARRTESPNAGWPMATMAGLLGVRLVKVDHYALGDADRPLTTAQITAAWRVTSVASVLAVGLLVLALEWLHA
jgi:adenosylcobinamide-phosphate synthase